MLPSAFAIWALCKHRYDSKIQKHIEFLKESVLNGGASGTADINEAAVRIFCIFALVFRKDDLPAEETKQLKGEFVRLWKQHEALLAQDVEQNIEYWNGSANYYVRIPACLINVLGLRGELVVDTFGGTGQTAVEAVKAGGRAITADLNSVAVLVAKSKLTYLSAKQRRRLKSITIDEIADFAPGKAPKFDLIEKWHHPNTLIELCQIRTFVQNQQDADVAQFLRATFSSILTMTTGRKGKQHGFFADNTPLSKDETSPPYENAMELFMAKLAKNSEVVQRLYSFIERTGRKPEEELKRAKALRVDVTKAAPKDYGVEENTVAGIITSPPYLCMSDYSLGQRLSYYWLFPEELLDEHTNEVGARRKRFQPDNALRAYLSDFASFAVLASKLLRLGGFLATVLGAPVAESFAEANILAKTDGILKEQGFSMLWSKLRPIHWHRNHGYARLKEERVAVFALGN